MLSQCKTSLVGGNLFSETAAWATASYTSRPSFRSVATVPDPYTEEANQSTISSPARQVHQLHSTISATWRHDASPKYQCGAGGSQYLCRSAHMQLRPSQDLTKLVFDVRRHQTMRRETSDGADFTQKSESGSRSCLNGTSSSKKADNFHTPYMSSQTQERSKLHWGLLPTGCLAGANLANKNHQTTPEKTSAARAKVMQHHPSPSADPADPRASPPWFAEALHGAFGGNATRRSVPPPFWPSTAPTCHKKCS